MTLENSLMLVSIILGLITLRVWIYLQNVRRQKILEFFEKIGFHDIHELLDMLTSSHHPSGTIIAAQFEHPLRVLLKKYKVVYKRVDSGRYVAVIVSHKPLKHYLREFAKFLVYGNSYKRRKKHELEKLEKEHILRSINFLVKSEKAHRLLVKARAKVRHTFRTSAELAEFFKEPMEEYQLNNESIEIKPFSKGYLMLEKKSLSLETT